MSSVNKPIFELGGLEIGASGNTQIKELFSGSSGRVLIVPSAYSIKHTQAFGIRIQGIHSAYLFTGLDYNVDGSSLDSHIQNSLTDFGIEGYVQAVNPKKQNQKASLAGVKLPSTTYLDFMDEVPVHYYAQPVDSKLPTDTTKNNTFLTKVIDESYVQVTTDSLCEFTIEVIATPTEDQWFYIPVANVKGCDSTIWGEVGNESTLPDGACAGLVKVYSEAWLETQLGGYTVTGDQLQAVDLSTFDITKSYDGVSLTINREALKEGKTKTENKKDENGNDVLDEKGKKVKETFYTPGSDSVIYDEAKAGIDAGNLTPDEVRNAKSFPNITRIDTLKGMVQAKTPWYAMGYTTGVSTVGTGLFVANVSGVNEVRTIPYSSTNRGIATKRQFTQDLSNPVYEVRMGDMMECGQDYLRSIADLGKTATLAPVGTLLPISGADIQLKDHTPTPEGSYDVPSSVNYRYSQPCYGDASVNSTPLYIPNKEGYHCYVPSQAVVPVTRFHMLRVTDLDEKVNLGLSFSPDIFDASNIQQADADGYVMDPTFARNTTASGSKNLSKIQAALMGGGLSSSFEEIPEMSVPYYITQKPEILYVEADDPVGKYYFDQAGFTIGRKATYKYSGITMDDYNGAQGQLDRWITTEIANGNLPSDIPTTQSSVGTGNGAGFDVSYHIKAATYYVTYKWVANAAKPRVGVQATSPTNGKTLGAGVSGMVMVFAGTIPAGTTPGTYKFKPFASTQDVPGFLDCVNASATNYSPVNVLGKVQSNTTAAPYTGLNLVKVNSPNLEWEYDTQSDGLNNYTYYRNLIKADYDRSKVTSKVAQSIVAIQPEHVPLIGYPMASKPVLIQIDDETGQHLQDMEDFCVTNPYYDEKLQEWLVVAASVKHGKMYRIRVDMDPTLRFVTKFQTVVDSAELFETPYGRFTELLGLCQTKDIHYFDEKSEETKQATAADILFLVDDSGSMPSAMAELKAHIGDMFDTLYNTGVDDVRVGVACYDTKQKAVTETSSGDKWVSTVASAQNLANQLAISFIPGTHSREAWHWSAIQWALTNYTFRDVKSKYIVLVTDAANENDPTSKLDIRDLLLQQGIKLDVISKDSSYFDPVVYDTDGFFIPMTPDESRTWGVVMSDTLGSKIVSEIKATYTVSIADDCLVLYGITEPKLKPSGSKETEEGTITEESADEKRKKYVPLTNLVVATCRTTLKWDANKDTIVRIRVYGKEGKEHTILDNEYWPHGVACLFPYIYVLGYQYTQPPTQLDLSYDFAASLKLPTGVAEEGAKFDDGSNVDLGIIINERTSLQDAYEEASNNLKDAEQAYKQAKDDAETLREEADKLIKIVEKTKNKKKKEEAQEKADEAEDKAVVAEANVPVTEAAYNKAQEAFNQAEKDRKEEAADDLVPVWSKGSGWQEYLWKIDITAGVVQDPILVKDVAAFRLGYGIAAKSSDSLDAFKDEKAKLGDAMLYVCGSDHVHLSSLKIAPGLFIPSSTRNIVAGMGIDIVQSKSTPSFDSTNATREYPSLTGLCAVAGQLMAFSNYRGLPVLLNPLTGVIETTGLSIFPYTYPFDANVVASGDTVFTTARFGDVNYYLSQPFYQLCIGDGVSPNYFGMGIDVHDITTGSQLVRKCYIRNNNIRDRLENVVLSVPSELVLPGSDMVYLSLTGKDEDKAKSITIPDIIHPCLKSVFYLHVCPTASYADENLVLYLNAKFSRVTEYFGYSV